MTTVTLPADKFDANAIFVRPEPLTTRAPLDKLAVLPGFNTRVKDADYNERVAAIAESIVNHGYFDDKPFAVTMLPDDDTIYIYDGEHRFDAARQAVLDGAEFPEGLPIAWAKDGATVRDLTIHLAHGNNGERLNMVESAAVVRRMKSIGMSKEEIAEAFGKTQRHIDNLFVLAEANQTVKKAVASGKIAGAEAVKLLRKDPKTAADKITEAVKKAEERGKAKATPKSMSEAPKGPKTKTVQMSINAVPGKGMGEMLKEMAKMIREFVEHDGTSDEIKTAALVRFSVNTVDREAEAEAARKAEEKAAKAEESKKLKEAKLAERDKAAKEKAKQKAAAKAAQEKLLKEAASGKGGKTTGEAKPRKPAQKPAGADSKPKATTTAKKDEKPASEAPAAENQAPLPDESMGGL